MHQAKWLHDNTDDDVPMHFTAFHPDFKMLDYPDIPSDILSRARCIALDAGIRYA